MAVSPARTDTGSSGSATSGGTSITVTMTSCDALSALFVAVTVTVAGPAATPVTVSIVPSTETVASSSDEDIAECTSAVPENALERSTMAVSPTRTDTGSSGSATSGGTSMTVTMTSCDALSALFVAVTVTVAGPAATPVTVSIVPSTETVASSSDEDIAECTSDVPEKAPVRSTWVVSSTKTDMGSMGSATFGGTSITVTMTS